MRGEQRMLQQSHAVLPSPNVERTADYYANVLGFKVEKYLHSKEAHICLYRDNTEIILTKANTLKVFPNRALYGYGYDLYIIADTQEDLQKEFLSKGAKIVRTLQETDYNNKEFVLEDIDGRWIGFGKKQ
ncbi:VOC family protein [Blautia liquoris]|uniref:VOC family protein n=2 Tax=Blautia liquoris TaxID=2779518 RepID=A0A7M2RNI3_9FIRM|nr:VOC family protein [Blautia liquoris]